MCSVIDLMSVVSILAVSSFGAEDLVLLDLFILSVWNYVTDMKKVKWLSDEKSRFENGIP